MTLATRVFVFFGALMILLVTSQWFVIRSITQDVSSELGKVAFSVAKDTASFFILGDFQWVSTRTELLTSGNQVEQITEVDKLHSSNTKNTTRVRDIQNPTVQIRIDNQRTDDFIELITATTSNRIPLPRSDMNATVERLEQQMLISSLVILTIGLIIAAFLAKRLMMPVRQLTIAAEKLAQGELGTQISIKSSLLNKDIRSSIETFNSMSKELREMQIENTELQENAHYKELGYISSGLAHSIRNPLNTLGLTIDRLSDVTAEDTTEKTNLTATAYRQIKRIDDWAKTFMTFSLGNKAETENVSLGSVIQNIQLEAKQQRPDVNFEINIPKIVTIIGIEAEIHAILHSLIINAVEVSPDSSNITINVEQDDKRAIVIIADQGDGISIAQQEHLFQPFKSTKSQGSGMGLYMAQKLASNRYQGDIELIKSDSSGTEMKVLLQTERKLS